MPSLLVLPGFPSTNGPGQEALGKGVDTVTLLTVTPDGTVGTVAQIRALVEASWAAGQPPLYLWRQPNSF